MTPAALETRKRKLMEKLQHPEKYYNTMDREQEIRNVSDEDAEKYDTRKRVD